MLIKEAKTVFYHLYKEYCSRRKKGISRSNAKQFGSVETIQKSFFPNYSVKDTFTLFHCNFCRFFDIHFIFSYFAFFSKYSHKICNISAFFEIPLSLAHNINFVFKSIGIRNPARTLFITISFLFWCCHFDFTLNYKVLSLCCQYVF